MQVMACRVSVHLFACWMSWGCAPGSMRQETPAVLPGSTGTSVATPPAQETSKPVEQSAKEKIEVHDRDPHSFSNPLEIVVEHLHLDLKVDFERRVLHGKARLKLKWLKDVSELWLDTRDLDIHKVILPGGTAGYSIGEAVSFLGRPMRVSLPPRTPEIEIEYSTQPASAALQWLSPEQTSGGKHPFLFTQSQAILARTWIPCQDTPTVRMTYSARIQVPPGLLAVMSAENPQQNSADGVYEFRMQNPIPSYLMALAAGDIAFQAIGERSGVYAEPDVLEKAAWELSDTESMVIAAEKLYGPYRWGRYDLIILPPSFPFGGMENPRLTFATPTILAGDRSLVALVAHELAHSWSGNLVTNATWNDFWLNEGFTVYFEHRIMEAVYGRDYEEMLALLSLQSLRKEAAELPARDTWLHLNLAGRDPDDGMTEIAYEKGYFFLRLCEETVGRERWDEFLRAYFERFAFHSMTTAGFVQHLRERLVRGDAALEKKLCIDGWVYGPGIPDNCPVVQTTALEEVEAAARSFTSGAAAATLRTDGWTTHHWLHFLRSLKDPLDRARLEDLDAAFHFTARGNSEILHDWLLHAIAGSYQPAYGALEDFLTRQGRRKFLKPLYKKMAETPEGMEMAKRIYQKARPRYHSVSAGSIDEILHWSSGSR